jgi:hypothetical protein
MKVVGFNTKEGLHPGVVEGQEIVDLQVCVVNFPARGTESSGGGLTEHPELIEKFSRGQIGRPERTLKWSHSHAIL